SPYLTNLTALDLTGNEIGPEGVQALVASPLLANLSDLDLTHNQIGQEGLRALASSPALHGLRRLHLGSNFSRDEDEDFAPGPGVERGKALAALPPLPQLTALDLSGMDLGEAGLRVVLESLRASSLVSLDLSGNALGAEGIRR